MVWSLYRSLPPIVLLFVDRQLAKELAAHLAGPGILERIGTDCLSADFVNPPALPSE